MFNALNLKINRGSALSNEPGQGTMAMHTYIDMASTTAAIKLYFPPNLGLGESDDQVFINDLMLIQGSDGTILAPIVSLVPFLVGLDIFTGGTALTMGAPIPPVDNNGARILGGILQMEIADQTHSGIMTAAPQTFGGEKTFTANVNINDPPEGIVISKTIGNMGVVLLTSDPNAYIGYVMRSASLPLESYGTIYRANGITGVTPELAILLGNDPAMVFNKADQGAYLNYNLFSNSLDTDSAVVLNIGTTNALSINLNATTIVDPTKELQTNQIDSATAAPLVLGATNTTFAVMNKGVQFLSSGGTPATLNDYEEYDHNTTFTNNTETTAIIDLFLVKTGDSIILRNATVASVPGQVAPNAFFSADTLLPPRFRPGQDCNGPFRVENNGVFSEGWIEVTAAGAVNIYNNVDFTTAFTAAVTNGFSSGTFAYSN